MTRTKYPTTVTANRDVPAQRAAALETLQAQAAELRAQTEALQVRLARGTREMPTHGPVPPVAAPLSPLYRACEALLSERPCTFRDLCAALGIDSEHENSLKSVLVRLQRAGRPVVNLGNGSRAIWWIDVHDRIGQIAAGKSRTVSGRK